MFMCVHYRDDTKRLVRVKRELENTMLRGSVQFYKSLL